MISRSMSRDRIELYTVVQNAHQCRTKHCLAPLERKKGLISETTPSISYTPGTSISNESNPDHAGVLD